MPGCCQATIAKSPRPSSMNSLMSASVSARICGCSFFIRPGEKYGLSTFRNCCWRGGSSTITTSPGRLLCTIQDCWRTSPSPAGSRSTRRSACHPGAVVAAWSKNGKSVCAIGCSVAHVGIQLVQIVRIVEILVAKIEVLGMVLERLGHWGVVLLLLLRPRRRCRGFAKRSSCSGQPRADSYVRKPCFRTIDAEKQVVK